jgi:hypothetical protein
MFRIKYLALYDHQTLILQFTQNHWISVAVLPVNPNILLVMPVQLFWPELPLAAALRQLIHSIIMSFSPAECWDLHVVQTWSAAETALMLSAAYRHA